MSESQAKQDTEATDQQPHFSVERIYVKDVSFEAPQSPQIFLEQWQPDIQVDLNIEQTQLNDETHEVVLIVSVKAKREDKVAILVEVKQAGIFTIKKFDDAQTKLLKGIQCPTILYPYAQQLCSQLVHQGGYPALFLAPINFEAMYHQHMDQKADAETSTTA